MQTERLNIRRFTADDIEAFCELIKDKMASPLAAYDDPFPTDDESLRGILGYFCTTDEFFAVELRENARLIGFIALNRVSDGVRNLGFCIHSAFQGRGLAFEAALAAVEFARTELKLNKLVSGTALLNTPSIRLLKRLGFIETERTQASFATDSNGGAITFTACSFELKL